MAGRIAGMLEDEDGFAATPKPKKRKSLVDMLTQVPGVDQPEHVGPQDQAVYAEGLKHFLDGDNEGAVIEWSKIPEHPEARRAMQRLLQKARQEATAF